MSYTLNKTGTQIDVILNRAEAGGQLDLDIAAEAAARAAADALKAPLASPALTGTPTAPTAAPGTDTTQLATTAFANAAAAAAAASAASGKADKVAGATAGNLAGLDGSGNLTDAGIAAADVATKGDVQNITPKRTSSNDPANSSFSVLCDTALAGQAKPTLYGKSVAINQICDHVPDTAVSADLTYTNNGDGSWTVSGTSTAVSSRSVCTAFTILDGHTYYIAGCPSQTGTAIRVYVDAPANSDFGGGKIFTWSTTATRTVQIRADSGFTANNLKFWPVLIDLTRIFTAAELTAIGTSVANLKSAWLAKFGYPLPAYLPYNAGSIVSNNATYQMHGRNLWEAEAASNYGVTLTIQDDGGIKLTGTATTSYNFIVNKYLKAGEYTLTCGYSGSLPNNSSARVQAFGGGLNIAVSNNQSQTQHYTGTLDEGATVELRIRIDNGFTYNTVLYPQLEAGDTAHTYEAPYNGGSVTADSLNGIGTALDSQDADGNIVRKIASVDLGTLDWLYASPIFYAQLSGAKNPAQGTDVANIMAAKYKTVSRSAMANSGEISLSTNGYVNIQDAAYSDVATFKAAVTGQTLLYELATPTTSTTTAANIQTQAGYNSLDPVSGDVQSADAEVEYAVDVIAYIDKKLAEL